MYFASCVFLNKFIAFLLSYLPCSSTIYLSYSKHALQKEVIFINKSVNAFETQAYICGKIHNENDEGYRC